MTGNTEGETKNKLKKNKPKKFIISDSCFQALFINASAKRDYLLLTIYISLLKLCGQVYRGTVN